uniref:Uncharacterized protein n=1 Tax=Candidatus Kentrum sp. UNK TaxID=2126344 RepID=A0A451ANT9_9GAMM|nr:MAG: hypothetical protein BECKUNK1418G_GA0071005_115913 [Candidatus Kentron sp. UNK]VFK73053.1 MAG: hypothetical protein BECKUNK1418H_GA0071006_115913 [Candidatus Kentron sp. UNK]
MEQNPTLWHMLVGLVTILGFMLAFAKIVLHSIEKRLSDHFKIYHIKIKHLEETATKNSAEVTRLNNDLLELKVDIANQYVHYDDYVRIQTILEAKLDGVALKIENIQMEGLNHARRS